MTGPASAPMAFIDLAAQRRRLGARVDEAIARVLDHCGFVSGPEVTQLETALARFCGARHVITCSSGTDALLMVLMARGIGAGDAVICPAFTFCATAEVVALAGATPVLADIDAETFNLDPGGIARGVAAARAAGLMPKAVIPVDLFGLPAAHDAIADVAREHGLFVLDDAAQAFGATFRGRKLGTFGLATATSFFPAKPLGCYGDGGAIFTDDDELASALRSIRVHGQGSDKYDTVRLGLTARLDTMQAAVLLEKLAIFPEEIIARNAVADRYGAALADVAAVPRVPDGMTSVWAQYTIKIPSGRRDAFAESLRARGVPTAIYYAKPLHRQAAYAHYPVADGGLAVSEALATEVISLPMHPYLGEADQARVIEAARAALYA